jgi:AraC-like DNA-binding protein
LVRTRGEAAPTLPARYIGELAELVGSLGVDVAPLLRAARIRTVDRPDAEVSLAQFERLIEAVERATGRKDLGFEFGKRLDPTTHDIIGYALLTSPTLGQMLRLATSYQRLMQRFLSLRMELGATHAELVYRPVVALSPRAMRVMQEAIVVSNHEAFVTTLGERLPRYAARLSMPRPPHAGRYRELRRLQVAFGEGEPGLRIVLPVAVLDQPLAMANPRAMRAAEQRCRALLQQTQARRRWSVWCRMMLRESEDVRPTLEQLAGTVNVSPRTLARYLEAEGAGFRELALQVRTERARELLRQGGLSVTQVAYRLGYTDVASFVRCFRAQTGVTPGTFAAAI